MPDGTDYRRHSPVREIATWTSRRNAQLLIITALSDNAEHHQPPDSVLLSCGWWGEYARSTTVWFPHCRMFCTVTGARILGIHKEQKISFNKILSYYPPPISCSLLALQPSVGLGLLCDFVTVFFSGLGSLTPHLTSNLEDQGLQFVWPLPFALCGVGCPIGASVRLGPHERTKSVRCNGRTL
jgi:hypothetical protein